MKTKKYPTKLIVGYSIYRITKGESYSDDLSTVFVTVVGILSAFSTTDCAFAVGVVLFLAIVVGCVFGVSFTVGAVLISFFETLVGKGCSFSNIFSGTGLAFLFDIVAL